MDQKHKLKSFARNSILFGIQRKTRNESIMLFLYLKCYSWNVELFWRKFKPAMIYGGSQNNLGWSKQNTGRGDSANLDDISSKIVQSINWVTEYFLCQLLFVIETRSNNKARWPTYSRTRESYHLKKKKSRNEKKTQNILNFSSFFFPFFILSTKMFYEWELNWAFFFLYLLSSLVTTVNPIKVLAKFPFNWTLSSS